MPGTRKLGRTSDSRNAMMRAPFPVREGAFFCFRRLASSPLRDILILLWYADFHRQEGIC